MGRRRALYIPACMQAVPRAEKAKSAWLDRMAPVESGRSAWLLGCGIARLDDSEDVDESPSDDSAARRAARCTNFGIASSPDFIILSTFLGGPALCLVGSVPPCS